LQEAVATLERKPTADEVEDYRRFVLTLARRVAAEQAAIDDRAAALGASG
jgi:hypothetical protein